MTLLSPPPEKDQALRQLSKSVSQLQQDKLELERGVQHAERGLRAAYLDIVFMFKGGPEIYLCYCGIICFAELFQMACTRMALLEAEGSSLRAHAAALKAELQDACLRNGQGVQVRAARKTVPCLSSACPLYTPCLSSTATLLCG
uniref:Uncharacterized protein n=1 Tax=Paramormyrops kingsleyae TaxID=1676925 RepID=A0A3B3SVG9_9TELE